MRTLVAVCGVCLVWTLLDLGQSIWQERRWKLFVHGLPLRSPQFTFASVLSVLSLVGRKYRLFSAWPRSEEVSERIQQAGLTGFVTVDAVLGCKITSALLGVVLGVVIRDIAPFLVISAILFFVPDLYLAARSDKRRREMQKTLPQIIDLLVIATEAGMSFESALEVVTRRNRKGVLYQELAQALDEIRLGSSQEDALRNLAQRLDHPDVTSFVLTLVQGQKLGTPISRILTVVAQQVRVKQANAFETEASKAPIKILFPLLLFIFPSLMVVLLGPVVLRGMF